MNILNDKFFTELKKCININVKVAYVGNFKLLHLMETLQFTQINTLTNLMIFNTNKIFSLLCTLCNKLINLYFCRTLYISRLFE